MAVFEGCLILLELKNVPFKEKTKLKLSITENGGCISFVINKQCSLVVTNDVSKLSSRLHRIQKYMIPVVGLDYVHSCLERNVLLPVDEFMLDISSPSALSHDVPYVSPQPARPRSPAAKVPTAKGPPRRSEKPEQSSKTVIQKQNGILDTLRVYKETDQDLPEYSGHFHVAKYSIFQKVNSNTWCVLELQSYSGDDGQKYRLVRYWMENKRSKRDMLLFPATSEEAVEVYKAMMENVQASGLKQEKDLPPEVTNFGSSPLQQLLLEEKLSTGVLSQSVGVFMELLWTEAHGCLDNTLQVPIDKLSINDVSRAEGLLIQAQREMKEANHAEVASLMDAVYTLLPHKVPPLHPDARLVSQKLDLCQLIRDVLNVRELTMSSSVQSCLGKYRALQCNIEEVPKDSSEFQNVNSLLQKSCDSNSECSKVNIQQILRVTRGVELQTFKSELGNIKSLFHSSTPRNFVGILSRGLVLPRVGVEDHGITRTDVGNLGGGIYFSDSLSTCIGYSSVSVTDGSRLMLVCDVALGACKDVYKKDYTLTQAPTGHMSVHAVCNTPKASSEFEHDEFVVYSPDQVRLKYVVQFSCPQDSIKKFSPFINMSDELPLPSPGDSMIYEKDEGIADIKNPLEDVKAGLLDSSGQQLPLQAVNVKCRLQDLLSQVIIFQKYTNLGTEPIEAKYVFPLDDSAAVCGFEAFINGKHVVGQVKEKEQARKEYKQAVEKGHGAYLMDQDAPDVFTISVGNLPPGATVIIKVTFVSELVIKDGSVFFSLPGSVAPWQESAALNQTTQVTLEKVCITDETAGEREFTLDMAIEMPYDITKLHCVTHKIRMKKTDCSAVVSVQPGEVMGPEGFQLFISLSAVHLPRMWVENHPDKDSQACMLVFYPDFDSSQKAATGEVILLLDMSESMRGESLRNARRLALHIIKTLDPNVRVNVVVFGTDHAQAFLAARPLAEAHEEAERFIKSIPPSGGSTELWRPLRLHNLLPPSHGTRNLLLLSDGHIQNGMLTLQMLRDNAHHSRLFTCGLSTTANRHMLRALAQAGGGAYEYFDTKTKHTWAHKVSSQVQRMSSPGCSSVAVKWQQFNPAVPSPVQAPKRLQSLFNDCHTIVFGFVPHCTQATLLGNLSGQELNTMVSTSELQKTRGTFLHKLTARAIIRDYEDGSLDFSEPRQEGKKSELKSYIIELSKEFSILSQFTSFVAIEERDTGESEKGYTDVAPLLAKEDVDILSYMRWESQTVDPDDFMDISFSDSSDSEDTGESEKVYGGQLFSHRDMDILSCHSLESQTVDQTPDDSEESLAMCSTVSSVAEGKKSYITELTKEFSILSRDTGESEKGYTDVAPLLAKEDVDILPYNWLKYQTVEQTPFDSEEFLDMALMDSSVAEDTGESENVYRGQLFSHRDMDIQSCLDTALMESSVAEEDMGVNVMADVDDHSIEESSLEMEDAVGDSFKESRTMMERNSVIRPRRSTVAYLTPPGLMANVPSPAYHPTSPSLFSHPPPPPPPPLMGSVLSPQIGLYKACCIVSPPDHPTSHSVFSHLPPAPLPLQMDSVLSPPDHPTSHSMFSHPPPAPLPLQMDSVLSPPDHPTSHSMFSHPPPPPLPPVMASIPLPHLYGASHSMSRGGRGGGGGPPLDSVPSPPRHPTSLSHLYSDSFEPSFKTGGFGFSHRTEQSQPFKGFGSCSDAQGLFDAIKKPKMITATAAYMSQCSDSAKTLTAQMTALTNKGVEKTDKSRTDEHPSAGIAKRRRGAGFTYLKTGYKAARSMSEDLELKWTKIFELQLPEGFWELTAELGQLIKVDLCVFADVFLKSKGINSLGAKARVDILRLLATLLVLQLMRVKDVETGRLLHTLFSLNQSDQQRPKRWDQLKRAVDWVSWADRQYPCICSRLEFGMSWESSTRQLLGFDSLPPFSPLRGLNLRTTAVEN